VPHPPGNNSRGQDPREEQTLKHTCFGSTLPLLRGRKHAGATTVLLRPRQRLRYRLVYASSTLVYAISPLALLLASSCSMDYHCGGLKAQSSILHDRLSPAVSRSLLHHTLLHCPDHQSTSSALRIQLKGSTACVGHKEEEEEEDSYSMIL
jgi:hypothetical protein